MKVKSESEVAQLCPTSLYFTKILFYLKIIFGCAESSLLHRLSSSCGEQGLLSSCGAWVSHCGGFSCCGAQTLGALASVAAACGLSSCGSRALEHRLSSWAHGLSCSVTRGIFLDQGLNPVSCTGSWIFTSEPPGKPLLMPFCLAFSLGISQRCIPLLIRPKINFIVKELNPGIT